ncbi:GntR family transcriptional regulator [Lederbergia ruris]|uniref:GntR family transcriptional regulator n=1 Tax=Lederbergia ruris TaxID=217495 RepID=A0ABQ4KN97_9BACI|nr:FCD domain-containing protein [Lederbergia ruris]GIN59408.1 GntR family transcriptional regulator [Lederbergia ruris]
MKETTNKKGELKNQIIEIIVGCLSKNRPLPSEKELTEKLNISRSGLRELLIEFEAAGIIVATQGKGRVVKFPDISNSIIEGWNILLKARPETLLELLDIRLILERGFLPSAIETLKLDDLQMMRDLVSRMESKALRNQNFKEEDQMFHQILYSRIQNMVLDQLLKAFWDVFEQMSELHESDNLQEGAKIHKELYQAILIQNGDEAERLLEMQFRDIRRRITSVVDKEADEGTE